MTATRPPRSAPPPPAARLRPFCIVALLSGLALGMWPPATLQAAAPDSLAAPDARSQTPDSVAVRPGGAAEADTVARNGTPGSLPGTTVDAAELRTAPFVAPPAGSPAAAGRQGTGRGAVIASLGFDNVSEDSLRTDIAYENRRFRHSAYARGFIDDRLTASTWAFSASPPILPRIYFERRLGMVAAAVEAPDPGRVVPAPGREGAPGELDSSAVPAAVRYPSDRDFPSPPPAGRALGATRWATDLEVVPLFAYELGRIHDPLLIRLELEPRIRVNPWPGARATASLLISLRNDFDPDAISPDIGRTRPGPITLEQFGWLPGIALVSGTVGSFADNRYGFSFGAARPLAGGAFLIDAQADLTGFIAFPATGIEYSGLERFTGFAGMTWRPPGLDLAVRLRAERFVYGDQGAEIELRRAMGDLDVALFYERTGGFNAHGVRLLIPVPPSIRRHASTHPPGRPVRLLPVDRLPLDYRDEAAPVGRVLKSVASREDYLRQLNLPGLAANAYRYRDARGWGSSVPPRGAPARVSLTGMTGFINTPWCGVMADRGLEVGYNQIPKEVAYDHRGLYRNDVYYAALGFLPHVEAGLRWTFIPGLKSFVDLVPDSKVTDSDRMLSGRLELLSPRPRRPGLAVGIEDASGTRRFHSTYVVTGIPLVHHRLHGRVSLGYAPRVFERVSRRTLDGAFGACEASLWGPVAASLEYDTEKWNTALGVDLAFGFRARVALLDGSRASVGAGWSVGL